MCGVRVCTSVSSGPLRWPPEKEGGRQPVSGRDEARAQRRRRNVYVHTGTTPTAGKHGAERNCADARLPRAGPALNIGLFGRRRTSAQCAAASSDDGARCRVNLSDAESSCSGQGLLSR